LAVEGGIDFQTAVFLVRDAHWLPDGSRLPKRLKAVLYALASRAPWIYPSQELLALYAGCSRAQVKRDLLELEAHGMVTRIRRGQASTACLLTVAALRRAAIEPELRPGGSRMSHEEQVTACDEDAREGAESEDEPKDVDVLSGF
jgi:biotin operon repressor